MSVVLPSAMLAATILGAAGIGAGLLGTPESDSIQLASGQHIRVGYQVRLSEEGKKQNTTSCLNTLGDGTVTSIESHDRKVTFRCRKGGKSGVETVSADILEVVSSGLTAPGLTIQGGYLIEGANVRLISSARATNKGKGLASQFANPIGVVTRINTKRKEAMVRTNSINNSKGTYEEVYSADDLEFVSGPSQAAKRGIKGGLIGIGTTVRLRHGKDGKIDSKVLEKYTSGILGTGTTILGKIASAPTTRSKTYHLTGHRHADAVGILRDWETFGKVTRVIVDEKSTKEYATVRCVSKDQSKSVVEEDYELDDLEAVPARSVPRPGIPIFGGMANVDMRIRLRAERKDAVASKPLGRSAFGDEGTVVDIQPNDKDNLQVLVVCNGKNPDELTKEWYEPEDLEIAEPEDPEGEPVFGGRVTVESTVRVRQSARGKQCLGKMEIGDVGMVKGIDPGAADNLKINVTCGRSMSAKQSEWYDPRDLEVFFGVEEAGTPLAQAQSDLLNAQRELDTFNSDQTAETPAKATQRRTLEADVKGKQEVVDKLSGQTVDKTKANEVFKNTKEKLAVAEKLKRDITDMRNKAAKETTCSSDPQLAAAYTTKANDIANNWIRNDFTTIDPVNMTGLASIQGSNNFKAKWASLADLAAPANRPAPPAAGEEANLYVRTTNFYRTKHTDEDELKQRLQQGVRVAVPGFDDIRNMVERVSRRTVTYDNLEPSELKSWFNSIDKKLQALQEAARDIETAAYSGKTPTEKLYTEIRDRKIKLMADQINNSRKLNTDTDAYYEAFQNELAAKVEYDRAKYNFDKQYRIETGQQNAPQAQAAVPGQTRAQRNAAAAQGAQVVPAPAPAAAPGATGPAATPAPAAASPATSADQLMRELVTKLKTYLQNKKATLDARKSEMLSSGENACIQISIQSTEDLLKKTGTVVDEKCSILPKFDDLTTRIDQLITSRNNAFLMAQAAIDINFKDHVPSGKFKSPVGEDFNERIHLLEEARDKFKADPSTATFADIESLSGKYRSATDPDGDQPMLGLKNALNVYLANPAVVEADTNRIKLHADRVVNDQVVRLKARVISQAAASDMAVQISNTADRDQQAVLDDKLSVQLELSKIASHNIKVGGAVDSHTDEIAKLATCNKEVKKDADEQYKKGLAEIDKLKKEMMEKIAEVKQNQQGQQGKKDYKTMDDAQLQQEIITLQGKKTERDNWLRDKAATATQGQIKSWKNEKDSFDQKLKDAIAERNRRNGPKPGGGRRRVTMRRHRVY